MPHPSPIPPPTAPGSAIGRSLLQPNQIKRHGQSNAHLPSDSSDSSGSESEEEYRAPMTDECLRAEFFIPSMMDSLTAYCTSKGGPKMPRAKLASQFGDTSVKKRHQTDGMSRPASGSGGHEWDNVGQEWQNDDEHLAFLRQQAGLAEQEHVVELVPQLGDAVSRRVGKRRRRDSDASDADERDTKRSREDNEEEEAVDDGELSYSAFLLATSTSFLFEPVEAAPLPDVSANVGALHAAQSAQDLGAPWTVIDSLPISMVKNNHNPCPICLAPLSHTPFDYAPPSLHRTVDHSSTAWDSSASEDDTSNGSRLGLEAETECITLPCMHLLHSACAQQSLAASRKCPECRCDIVEAVKRTSRE